MELHNSLPSLEHRARLASYGLRCVALSVGLFVLDVFVPENDVVLVARALVGVGYVGSVLCSALLVCRWLHLATRHALARGIATGASPNAAVLSALVPIANYFVPFQLVRRMFRAVKRPTEQVTFSQVLILMSAGFGAFAAMWGGHAASLEGVLSNAAHAGAAITASWAIRSLRFE